MAAELSFFQITSLIIIYSFCGIQSGLDYATSISTYPRLSFIISPFNKDDHLAENITTYYLVGSILAGIFFLFTKNWMRKVFLISDIIIIVGYLVTIFSNKPTENTLYFSRFFGGFGITTLNLVGPLMVCRHWPNSNLLLASFGLCYQLGQSISDIIVIEEWRYEMLGPCVVALVQLILVSFTNKVVFECEEVLGETHSENIRGKFRFAKSVAKACVIQLMTTMIGLQWVSNFGPKLVHDLPSLPTPISIAASIISMIMVKFFEIKKLLFSSFFILTCELVILAILVPNSGERMTLVLFSVYLFSYISGLSSPPLVYTVKLFRPESRGEGIGLVSSVSESTYLIVKLTIKQLGLKISEKEMLWILAVTSFLALIFMSRFLRFREEDKEKDKDKNGGPDLEADISHEVVSDDIFKLNKDTDGEPDLEADIPHEVVSNDISKLNKDTDKADIPHEMVPSDISKVNKDRDGGPDPESDIPHEVVPGDISKLNKDRDGGPDPEADIPHEVVPDDISKVNKDRNGGPDPEADIPHEVVPDDISKVNKDRDGGPDPESDIPHEVVPGDISKVNKDRDGRPDPEADIPHKVVPGDIFKVNKDRDSEPDPEADIPHEVVPGDIFKVSA